MEVLGFSPDSGGLVPAAVGGARVLGRVCLVRCDGPMGGTPSGLGAGTLPDPEALTDAAARMGARTVLVDATEAPYADSDGLRWLLRLRGAASERGLAVRVAARPKGRVWRNVALLAAGFELFPSVREAWNGVPYAGAGKGGRCHVTCFA